MRKPIFGGNWKMHKTMQQAVRTVGELKKEIQNLDEVEVVVFPPFTALSSVKAVIEGSSIALGAQNMHEKEEGAYTGEISSSMLLDIGCEYVILGHSERRQYFGENDNQINKKARAALSSGLIPILCVIALQDGEKLVIAYEPVWAIGTGETATPEQAQEMHRFIRITLKELLGKEIANSIRIQYGGSAKPDNIKGLMCQPDIDGALVGGASLEASSFARIIKYKE